MRRVVSCVLFCALFGAFAVWWAVAVLCGLGLYELFPPDLSAPDPAAAAAAAGRTYSFRAGISLGRHWQNIPGNVLGFIAALYTFQGLLRRSSAGSTEPA